MVSFDPAYDDRAVLPCVLALRGGDWRPAAALLQHTGHDWDRKAHQVNRLAHGRGARRAIAAWVAAQPYSPDAHLTHARALLAQAWDIRGHSYAKQVPKKAWGGFFEHLQAADAATGLAIELAPGDPTPWAVAVMLARGLQVPRDEFDRRWAGLSRRDPLHVDGHYHAMQYLSAKWSGSHEEMYAFADRVSDTAPLGSPLHLLPVFAVTEYRLALLRRSSRVGPLRDFSKGAQVRRAVERAVELWEKPSARSGVSLHAKAVFDRTHLAYNAWFNGAKAVAARQYRAMGPYSSELPWSYFSPRPRYAARLHRLIVSAGP